MPVESVVFFEGDESGARVVIWIVVPAHNESVVLPRLLASLRTSAAAPRLGDVADSEVAIVVVANGCTDDTAAVARSAWPDINVIETDVPSKSNALNLGDAAAGGFPRFYVDADVRVEVAALRAVADVLKTGPALAAAPAVHFEVSRSSWAVGAFYRVWSALPYFQSGMVGSGIYAVSAEGRKRFGSFPPIIADDAFVRLHFKPHERVIVEGASFTVTAPQSLWGLIKIKTRSHLGNVELKMKYPHLFANEEVRHAGGLARLARRPTWWPALAVYMFVKFVTRYRAWRQMRAGRFSNWERDDSSRTSRSASGSETAT